MTPLFRIKFKIAPMREAMHIIIKDSSSRYRYILTVTIFCPNLKYLVIIIGT